MLESLLALLFLGAVIFVATTGERSDDKKPEEDKKQDKQDS